MKAGHRDLSSRAAAGVGGGAGAFAGRGAVGGVGGVPWSRLVAGGGAPGFGGLTGIGPTPLPGVLAAQNAALSELAAARRAAGPGGFMSPGMFAQAAGDDERERQGKRLPTMDHRLFTPDQRGSAPVIGDLTDEERNVGR